MKNIRSTSSNNLVAASRIFLGVVLLMTGIMKLTLSDFSAAWSIQLLEAEIPFYDFNYWFVPIFEILLGIIILFGYYTRIGALMIIPVMAVAIYVHLTVTNPAAFPAQPQAPYAPVAIILLAIVLLSKGGGNWSLDFKSVKENK